MTDSKAHKNPEIIWTGGERHRPLGVYRSCKCGVCTVGCNGVGYLSYSNAQGEGLTVWIQDEDVFQGLSLAFRKLRAQRILGATTLKP